MQVGIDDIGLATGLIRYNEDFEPLIGASTNNVRNLKKTFPNPKHSSRSNQVTFSLGDHENFHKSWSTVLKNLSLDLILNTLLMTMAFLVFLL